ncbi:MBL fold metallo-hydrolase [Bacteroidota bacterium]
MNVSGRKKHKDGERYVNYDKFIWPTAGEYLSSLWDWIFGKEERVPKKELPQQKVNVDQLLSGEANQLKSVWLGHSSMLINLDGNILLTDPLFKRYATLLGPVKFNKELPLQIESLPEIDAVLISHNHHDHFNAFTIKRIKNKVKRFCVPLGVGADLIKCGVPAEKISEFDWWDEINISEELNIAAAPAQHFSGRKLNDRDKTLWASWVAESTNHKIFFSGDSGYSTSFKDIGDKYGPFDLTLMEIGAYDKRWHQIHMYPEEAVQAHIDLKGKILHPIHWGTFNLSLHSWYEPVNRLTAEATKQNVKTITPFMGEIVDYTKHYQNKNWWNYSTT